MMLLDEAQTAAEPEGEGKDILGLGVLVGMCGRGVEDCMYGVAGRRKWEGQEMSGLGIVMITEVSDKSVTLNGWIMDQ